MSQELLSQAERDALVAVIGERVAESIANVGFVLADVDLARQAADEIAALSRALSEADSRETALKKAMALVTESLATAERALSEEQGRVARVRALPAKWQPKVVNVDGRLMFEGQDAAKCADDLRAALDPAPTEKVSDER